MAEDEVVNDEPDNNEEVDDGSITADIDGEDHEEPEVDQEQDKEPEKPDLTADFESIRNENKTLKQQLEQTQKEVNRLGFKLRKESKETPSKDEPEFTDQELLQIMREHKDDENVMLQVVKQMVKQGTKNVEQTVAKTAELTAMKKEVDTYITQLHPQVYEEGSEINSKVNENAIKLGLQDHPMKEFLSFAAMNMAQLPQIIENAKEAGRKEALSSNAEASRKNKINASKPAKQGSGEAKTGYSLTPTEMETAKAMFGNDKAKIAKYAKMIAKTKKGKASLQAEA